MFDLKKHRREYCYDLHTVVDEILPTALCQSIVERANRAIACNKIQKVEHKDLGAEAAYLKGEYLFHLFKGDDIRAHLPEFEGIYHSLLPTISAITMQDAIVSPYPDSDINIKSYPKGGGVLGRHKDTNGISCLIYLTTNTEGALVLELEKDHPGFDVPKIESKRIYPRAGSMLVMQGRKLWHLSEPTQHEQKMTTVLNYYVRGDTWRPKGFDDSVYGGAR